MTPLDVRDIAKTFVMHLRGGLRLPVFSGVSFAVGRGANKVIEEQIASLGSNFMYVFPERPSSLAGAATPRYLTAGFILEEGLDVAVLAEVVLSMQVAAAEAAMAA